MLKLSERIQRVAPSPTLAITARAKAMKAAGVDIISFGAGEPDFDTPEIISREAIEAIKTGKTRYTPASGIRELRQAVAADYALRDRQVTAEEVIITVGGKQALYNATQVLFEAGDPVIIPAPYWVSYPAQLHLAGAEPIFVSTTAEEDFKLTAETLQKTIEAEGARGLILCSPSNPTGATYTAQELAALGEVIQAHPDFVVFFDAMYDRLYFDGPVAPDLVAQTPAIAEQVLTFNGFSKTYSMTGWRLGYAIGPREVIQAMGTLQSQSTSNTTSFVQYGGLKALELDDEILETRRQAFQRRRDLIVAALNEIDGVFCPTPSGAFYVFPDFSAYLQQEEGGPGFVDDLAMTDYLLTEANVAVVPGSAFGSPGGLRLSYAMEDEVIAAGVARIKAALKGRLPG